MRGYELTERGRVAISVAVVCFILLLVSLLAFSSCSGTPPPPDDPYRSSTPAQSPSVEDTPSIAETPLPDDSGVEPSDPPETPEPPPETPEPPPETPEPHDGNGNGGDIPSDGDDVRDFGLIGLNVAEGTMQFIFSPDVQNTLDGETVSMLSDFLSSPKNTEDAQIQVEMPDLSEEDTSLLLAAIAQAFSLHNIALGDIVYIKNSTEITERFFEVELSYYVDHNKK